VRGVVYRCLWFVCGQAETGGGAGREQRPSYMDMKGETGVTRRKADLLEGTLLVKPKVLLESVIGLFSNPFHSFLLF
jgi:hypothetical protein